MKKTRGMELDRYLRQLDVWAIAFGCIVGWGAFVMPGTTFLPIAGPGGTLIAMAVCVLIMMVIGSNYAFLMVQRPGTGGVYAYTKEAFGRDHAFLCTWFLSLSYISIVFLNATALLLVSRTLLGDLLQVGFHYVVEKFDIYLGEVALSAVCLVVIGIFFILEKPFLQYFETVLALLLLGGTVFLFACCLPRLGGLDLPSNFWGTGHYSPLAVMLTIVLLSPWAFVGFDVICLETAHFGFPVEKSRKLIFLSILAGGFVYAAMTLISISGVPARFGSWQEYIGALSSLSGMEAVPAFQAAGSLLGRAGVAVMAVTAVAAILTGVIGAYRAAIRVLSTMAEDRILSNRFSSTSFCVFFIMMISVMITLLGRNALEWFVELTAFGAIVGFGYTSASAYRLARAAGNKRVMATGALGTMLFAVFAALQMIPKITVLETMEAESFLLLAAWCLLGFWFYWRTMRQGETAAYDGTAISSTVLFALLLYSVFMWFALKISGEAPYPAVREAMVGGGMVAAVLLALGLAVMVYIQMLLRRRHEVMEREKLHAEESSQAKTQFLFNMSHDIRTPMNAIIGYTNLAKKEETSEQLREYLDKIESSSRHLLDLIGDILEMSRIENGSVELESVPTDLTQVLEELRSLFSQQMLQKKLDFEVSCTQMSHRTVLCDRKNLNRVLLNIVSNAYKFTPEGGSIHVTLREEGSGADGTGSYEFCLKDTGIGMSRDFAARMFTAFERERSAVVSGIQGTGLGLAITKSIVDLMGGTIEVDTERGKGTEFRIYVRFPLCREEEVEKKDEPASEEAKDFSGRRLLLVEDNLVNREIARAVLEGFGFAVEDAANGQEAVDRVSEAPAGYYCLVLMDIQMPVMNGYDAARAIRSLRDRAKARIPILAMTANAFEEDKRMALESGMNGHVAKPIDVKDLADQLQRTLEME